MFSNYMHITWTSLKYIISVISMLKCTFSSKWMAGIDRLYMLWDKAQEDLKVSFPEAWWGGDPERERKTEGKGPYLWKNGDHSYLKPHSNHSKPECKTHAKHFMWLDYHFARFFKVLCFSLQQYRPKYINFLKWRLYIRACERSGAWSERGAERAKYSRSAERVFIQRPERSLCLAPVPLQYRSHHESRACTNPSRIHLCLQQLTKLSAYTSKIVRCEGEMEFVNISKSKPTGHTGAQFLSKN